MKDRTHGVVIVSKAPLKVALLFADDTKLSFPNVASSEGLDGLVTTMKDILPDLDAEPRLVFEGQLNSTGNPATYGPTHTIYAFDLGDFPTQQTKHWFAADQIYTKATVPFYPCVPHTRSAPILAHVRNAESIVPCLRECRSSHPDFDGEYRWMPLD